jgi:hypothetical protein
VKHHLKLLSRDPSCRPQTKKSLSSFASRLHHPSALQFASSELFLFSIHF